MKNIKIVDRAERLIENILNKWKPLTLDEYGLPNKEYMIQSIQLRNLKKVSKRKH